METKSLGTHQGTYDAVFQHPIARNLQWRDVRSMLNAIADESQEHTGNFKFTRNGQTLTIHPPQRKDFSDIHELMLVRSFLEKSAAPLPKPAAPGTHLLVVVDHREARVYKTELQGSVPERITAFEPHGSGRYLHNVEDHADGHRKPELKTFYEAIARTLNGAEKILILGSATGSSSAMEHLVAELKLHHAPIAERIVGALVVDEQHMSEPQLLAHARAFYAAQ